MKPNVTGLEDDVAGSTQPTTPKRGEGESYSDGACPEQGRRGEGYKASSRFKTESDRSSWLPLAWSEKGYLGCFGVGRSTFVDASAVKHTLIRLGYHGAGKIAQIAGPELPKMV